MSTVVLIGVLGFRFISNYSWLDAFYMTIITLATVGFWRGTPTRCQCQDIHGLTYNLQCNYIFVCNISDHRIHYQ